MKLSKIDTHTFTEIHLEMNFYEEDECNTFVGTDSTVFPAYMNKDDGSLLIDFCVIETFLYCIMSLADISVLVDC